MKQQRKEDAVSPVIGVMLMLVVTIVIAAVVVGFSTGLAGSTKTTPNALFEIEYIQLVDNPKVPSEYRTALANFGIKHKGGDPIPLEDIQLTLEKTGIGTAGVDGIIQILKPQKGDKDYNNMVMSGTSISPKGKTYPLMVLGKGDPMNDPVTGVTIETGDILRVVQASNNGQAAINYGMTVKWTLSYVPTNGIIAKGEFVVPEK